MRFRLFAAGCCVERTIATFHNATCIGFLSKKNDALRRQKSAIGQRRSHLLQAPLRIVRLTAESKHLMKPVRSLFRHTKALRFGLFAAFATASACVKVFQPCQRREW